MPTRRPYIGGNWKMNTDRAAAKMLTHEIVTHLPTSVLDRVDVVICPPFPYLITVALELDHHGSTIRVGAQDVFYEPDGAFTGEVSASMLHDCSAPAVLIGHSERRHVIGESDDVIRRKLKTALDANLECILCIGETLQQRDAGQTDEVNERQLRAAFNGISPLQMERVTIAYEPVWAIGTGKTATPEDAQAAHRHVRTVLADLFGLSVAEATRIQYGGSVKGDNAASLMSQPDIDGALVGGASLKAKEFVQIVQAAAASTQPA